MQKSYYRLNNRRYSIYTGVNTHKKTHLNRCELSMLQAVDNFSLKLLFLGHFTPSKKSLSSCFFGQIFAVFAEIQRFFCISCLKLLQVL